MTCGFCGKDYLMDQKEFPNACPKCALLGLTGKLVPQDIKRNKAHRGTNTPKQGKVSIKGKKSQKTAYTDKTINELLNIARDHFNRFIRERDRQGDYFYCPTCKKTKKIEGRTYQACHVFPAGLYPALRFHEFNVWGGCLQCNYHKHGTNYEYNDWLRAKIGDIEYQKLLDIKNYWQQHQWKWDKFYLIDIIQKYK